MKKLLSLMVVLASCSKENERIKPRYDDIVHFKFTGENYFYEKACKNVGIVVGQISSGKEYLVLSRCGASFKAIWIPREDIISVVDEK